MRSTVIAECTDCNAERCRFSSSGTREQVTRAPEQDGVRGSYSIESERVESSLWLLALCCLSLGLVVGVGVGRTIGIWK